MKSLIIKWLFLLIIPLAQASSTTCMDKTVGITSTPPKTSFLTYKPLLFTLALTTGLAYTIIRHTKGYTRLGSFAALLIGSSFFCYTYVNPYKKILPSKQNPPLKIKTPLVSPVTTELDPTSSSLEPIHIHWNGNSCYQDAATQILLNMPELYQGLLDHTITVDPKQDPDPINLTMRLMPYFQYEKERRLIRPIIEQDGPQSNTKNDLQEHVSKDKKNKAISSQLYRTAAAFNAALIPSRPINPVEEPNIFSTYHYPGTFGYAAHAVYSVLGALQEPGVYKSTYKSIFSIPDPTQENFHHTTIPLIVWLDEKQLEKSKHFADIDFSEHPLNKNFKRIDVTITKSPLTGPENNSTVELKSDEPNIEKLPQYLIVKKMRDLKPQDAFFTLNFASLTNNSNVPQIYDLVGALVDLNHTHDLAYIKSYRNHKWYIRDDYNKQQGKGKDSSVDISDSISLSLAKFNTVNLTTLLETESVISAGHDITNGEKNDHVPLRVYKRRDTPA